MTDVANAMPTPPLIIFAGGGSGGHLFPGLAVAERLREIEPAVRLLFLCSDKALDREILNEAGVGWRALPARPPGVRPGTLLAFAGGWRHSIRLAREAITEHKSESGGHLVTMGGYVAAPAVAAARRLGLPVTLVNLDAIPGLANRWIARQADHILSAVHCPRHPHFNGRVIGMPIRRAAIGTDPPAVCRRRLGLESDRPTLLVTGASQGAGTLNDLMIDLCRTAPSAFDGWQVLHLSGPADERRVLDAYRKAGVRAVVRAFCTEMGEAWGSADLALSRAGASSVAEAAANAVPSLFAPYPWHRDQHQKHNVEPLAESGLAWLADDRADREANLTALGVPLLGLMADSNSLDEVHRRLRARPREDAALDIAQALLGRPEGVELVERSEKMPNRETF